TARVAVITAGPWTEGLLAGTLPRDPRLTVTVQQGRYFAPRPGAGSWPTLIAWPPRGPGWYAGAAPGGAPGGKGRGPHARPAGEAARRPVYRARPGAGSGGVGVRARPPAGPGPGRAGRGDLPVHEDRG